MKTRNEHQFANVHFICSIAALKARNNRISNQNLLETVIAVPAYMTKKMKTFHLFTFFFTSQNVGKRLCNVLRLVSGYSPLLIRNPP